jgi:hypothetical protein
MLVRSKGYSMPSIEHAISQQRSCAGRWWIDDEHAGAWAGLCDWLMEECLMEQERRMSILWKKESEFRYRLDAIWTADKDWATGRWYATRDGKACLADFPDPSGAMIEAENLRKADKPYAEIERIKRESTR